MSPVLHLCEFAVHDSIFDKPETWDPSYAKGWKTISGTLEDLRAQVQKGGAFVPSALHSAHRSNSAFRSSDLAVVDIDHGLSVEQFLEHPLAQYAAWVYTTCSHDPVNEKHRFRAIFRLPSRIEDPDLFRAINTILSSALGGDKSCKDVARIFYGNSRAEHPLWQPDAVLPSSILDDANREAARARSSYNPDLAHYDSDSIEKARFVLEGVIPPTNDGERDLFIRVTAAARSAGMELFPCWSDWASRGHHGKGKNSRQAGERFFLGLRGSSLGSLFFLASDLDPTWRDRLPDELKGGAGEDPMRRSFPMVAGYSHEDFLNPFDFQFEPSPAEPDYGLFNPDAPWAARAKPSPPPQPRNPGNDFEDDQDDPLPPPSPEEWAKTLAEAERSEADSPKRRSPGRPKANAEGEGENLTALLKEEINALYPGLRLNLVNLELEYGPARSPQIIQDLPNTYIHINERTGRNATKSLVADITSVVASQNSYHPVRRYIEACSVNAAPCPYFDRLASELLGEPTDNLQAPKLPNGELLSNAVLKRFLIAAVARVFSPGCSMPWMPILVGSQNCGKSKFFEYLTPPSPSDPGTFPWVCYLQQGIKQLKEKPHSLHAGWIVVLDETERYFRREYVEELKNLISVSVDRSARKYENERSFPRAFVLAGATNSTDFLRDPTGNRRFMPIHVAGKVPSRENDSIKTIDLDRLQRDRDSIWAAAYKAYLDKPVWEFTSYELESIRGYIEGFFADNPIQANVMSVLSRNISGYARTGEAYVTLADLFSWLRLDITDHRSMTTPITDVLKRLGYTSRRQRIMGRITYIWVAPSPPEQAGNPG